MYEQTITTITNTSKTEEGGGGQTVVSLIESVKTGPCFATKLATEINQQDYTPSLNFIMWILSDLIDRKQNHRGELIQILSGRENNNINNNSDDDDTDSSDDELSFSCCALTKTTTMASTAALPVTNKNNNNTTSAAVVVKATPPRLVSEHTLDYCYKNTTTELVKQYYDKIHENPVQPTSKFSPRSYHLHSTQKFEDVLFEWLDNINTSKVSDCFILHHMREDRRFFEVVFNYLRTSLTRRKDGDVYIAINSIFKTNEVRRMIAFLFSYNVANMNLTIIEFDAEVGSVLSSLPPPSSSSSSSANTNQHQQQPPMYNVCSTCLKIAPIPSRRGAKRMTHHHPQPHHHLCMTCSKVAQKKFDSIGKILAEVDNILNPKKSTKRCVLCKFTTSCGFNKICLACAINLSTTSDDPKTHSVNGKLVTPSLYTVFCDVYRLIGMAIVDDYNETSRSQIMMKNKKRKTTGDEALVEIVAASSSSSPSASYDPDIVCCALAQPITLSVVNRPPPPSPSSSTGVVDEDEDEYEDNNTEGRKRRRSWSVATQYTPQIISSSDFDMSSVTATKKNKNDTAAKRKRNDSWSQIFDEHVILLTDGTNSEISNIRSNLDLTKALRNTSERLCFDVASGYNLLTISLIKLFASNGIRLSLENTRRVAAERILQFGYSAVDRHMMTRMTRLGELRKQQHQQQKAVTLPLIPPTPTTLVQINKTCGLCLGESSVYSSIVLHPPSSGSSSSSSSNCHHHRCLICKRCLLQYIRHNIIDKVITNKRNFKTNLNIKELFKCPIAKDATLDVDSITNFLESRIFNCVDYIPRQCWVIWLNLLLMLKTGVECVNPQRLCEKCLEFAEEEEKEEEGEEEVDEREEAAEMIAEEEAVGGCNFGVVWYEKVEKEFGKLEKKFEEILRADVPDEQDRIIFKRWYSTNIERMIIPRNCGISEEYETIKRHSSRRLLLHQQHRQHFCSEEHWGVARLNELEHHISLTSIPKSLLEFERLHALAGTTTTTTTGSGGSGNENKTEDGENELPPNNNNSGGATAQDEDDDDDDDDSMSCDLSKEYNRHEVSQNEMDNITRSVEFSRREIEIHTKCPDCDIAIIRFSGCFLMVCVQCSAVFCALCSHVIRRNTSRGSSERFRTLEPKDYKHFLTAHNMNYSFDEDIVDDSVCGISTCCVDNSSIVTVFREKLNVELEMNIKGVTSLNVMDDHDRFSYDPMSKRCVATRQDK